MKKGLVLFATVAVIAAAVVAYRQYVLLPGQTAFSDADRASLNRLALAETENLNHNEAIKLWSELLGHVEDKAEPLRNLAISHASQLRSTLTTINSPDANPQDRDAARTQLPIQAAQARQVTQDLLKVTTGNDSEQAIALWLAGYVEIVAAEPLAFEDKQLAMGDLATRLIEQLKANPTATLLVAMLDDAIEMSQDPLSGGTTELAAPVAQSLLPASAAAPRNTYVAFRALSRAIQAENMQAMEAVERLSKSMVSLDPVIGPIFQSQIKMTPPELVNALSIAIEAKNFSQARLLARQWENLVLGTTAYKSDLKAAEPHPLDLIATSQFNQLSRNLAAKEPVATSNEPTRFLPTALPATDDQDVAALASWDVDLDDEVELLQATQSALAIRKHADGTWVEVAGAAIPSGTRGITVADLFIVDGKYPELIKRDYQPEIKANPDRAGEYSKRHAVYPSILIWGEYGLRVFRFDGRDSTAVDQRLIQSEGSTGLESLTDLLAVIPVDFDADGDLDLVTSSAGIGVELWLNRDNMTFTSVSQYSELPASDDPVVDFAIVDLDRDLDVDILTIQKSGTVGWLQNLLHFQLRWLPIPEARSVGAGESIAAVEWDGNVSWDIAYSGDQGVGLLLTETPSAGTINVIASEELMQAKSAIAGRLQVADFDNDSWSDLLLSSASGAAIVSGGTPSLATAEQTKLTERPVTAVTTGEMTSDSGLDVMLALDNGAYLFENTTAELGHVIKIQMHGIDDNATGRVNHYAVGSTHELRFGDHYRAAVVTDRTTRFGLGKSPSANTLRTILTNGVTQNVVNPPLDTLLVEEQTLKGSCPYLYTWDGEKFVFVTDCLWAAPLGLQFAMGQVVPDRPWEYLKVDGRYLAPKDDHYELRLTEELWELAYFDHVSLIAVDHPADVDIWTNEKVGPPTVTEHQIFAFKDARPITAAIDTSGRDVTQLLASRDERYVQGFEDRILQGLCPPHWIDLELGTLAADDRCYLLLTGWILPTDSSLNIQIEQNQKLASVEPPSVWIPDDQGDWSEAIPAMGFPGGKTKTIVVDLTGKINPLDTRVRIRTSAQIYWDAAQLVVNPPEPQIVTQTLQLKSAEVAWHGFSNQLPRESTQPHRYDYHATWDGPKWPPLEGGLTRFGDCRELLSDWDDAMVVIAGGDEIRLRFLVPEQKPPAGWKRDFVLHCVGWDKDADLNTLAGQSVDPLPFRLMQSYPPKPEQYEQLEKVERLNAWHRTRNQSFRKFWTR